MADWHAPHYPNRNRSHELPGPEPGDEPDLERYLAFLRAQVRELCSQYGELGAFWWDMVEEGKEYLRPRDMPANDLVDTVMIVKLEFDRLPGYPTHLTRTGVRTGTYRSGQ